MTTPEHTPTTDDLDIEVEHFDSPDAQRLRAAQRLEIDRAYGQDTEPGEKPTAESIAVFFVARDASGTPLGCGGLRIVQDGITEIKRMYVRPESRGAGVSTALLRRLEEAAPKALDAPECRHHGTVCGLGVNWPQPYIHDQEDELREWLGEVRGDLGRSRRERWAINVHERVPAAEIEQRKRDLAEALAELKAENAAIEAQLRGEQP